MIKDYYSTLEIIYPSNQLEIKSNYKKLAKKFHPDINESIDSGLRMQEINEAYQILSNLRHKKIYDQYYEINFLNISNKNDSSYADNWNKNVVNLESIILNIRKQALSTKNSIIDELIGSSKSCLIAIIGLCISFTLLHYCFKVVFYLYTKK